MPSMGRKKKPAADRAQQICVYPKRREIKLMQDGAKADGHRGDWRDWMLAVALERARERLVG